jgi:hypothetical protein
LELTLLEQFDCSPVANSSPNFVVREKFLNSDRAIFAKEKPKNVEHETRRRVTKHAKEQIMEYLILLAVVSTVALYALIIVGCLKQPEW